MKVDVAIGEIFDKLTILDIKLERIDDSYRLFHINHEKDILRKALKDEGVTFNTKFYYELKDVNEKIWDTEDGFRVKEVKQEFDEEFVSYARLNAKYNDTRFLIKKRINEYYNSSVMEHKSYDKLYTAD